MSDQDLQEVLAGIGTERHAFRFEKPADAKRAWERAAKRCRHIALYRTPMDPPDLSGPQAVIVLGEERSRATVAQACRIIAGSGGVEFTPKNPDAYFGPFVARRMRLLIDAAQGGPEKWAVRNPAGQLLSTDGRNLGPYRRPQG